MPSPWVCVALYPVIIISGSHALAWKLKQELPNAAIV